MRADMDARARLGFYTANQKQKALHMEPHTADSIYKDFLAQKSSMDHGSNVLRLAKKYKVELEDITSLALVTYKVPDFNDRAKRAQLPPSQHKPTAGLLLQGCAQAEDPLAIVHILTAVYLNSTNAHGSIKEIARLFPPAEVAKYRKLLDTLTARANKISLGPDVLTLKGLFLEQEGQKEQAIWLYQEAVQRCHFKFTPGSRHPLQLPLIAPWNALGYLLKSDKVADVRSEAKTYFKKGALEADDPLSYFELAAFEPRTGTQWLQYTTKAAASGHSEAIVNVATFYQDVAASDPAILNHSPMRKALNWLLSWQPGSAAVLAREWLQAASMAGHKPSMLKLADYYTSIGAHERAKEYLRKMLDPPLPTQHGEEWPQLVQVARQRLR
ncbi:hypothetical protein BDW02DRAFT_598972 [Decorospora gaudefroyi]|uniref:TPR-like protein n=1 Tax=Decorospora gaudefroyi TaxID=184978 RepID=A0A6A5KJ67_9PLEO|nr:hypothetical protein BDW02DRAFT_598972 [Decorospora gaudefroyi]